MEKISEPCIRVKQHGEDIYVFQISGKKLLSISYVARRSEDIKKGIQRILKKGRIKKIANYIDSEGSMFPNSIIVNIEQKDSKFIPSKEDKNVGTIEFNNKPESIWIVDGQHRIHGFDKSETDFPVIVSALINADLERIAGLFYKINREAKKVDPSLAYDLLGLLGKDFEDPIAYGLHNITKKINEDRDSPLNGLIRMTDAGDGEISQANVIVKLRWFLKHEMGSRFVPNEQVEEKALTKLIKYYFSIIKELQPVAWNDENNEYLLKKGLGFGAMIYLLPKILFNTQLKYGVVTPENMRKMMEPLSEIDFKTGEDSSSPFIGMQGEQGMREIAKIISSDYLNLDVLEGGESLI